MHVHPTALDPGPYLVLDLSRGLDPHQARCRPRGARLPGPAGATTLPHLARVGPRSQASRSWSW